MTPKITAFLFLSALCSSVFSADNAETKESPKPPLVLTLFIHDQLSTQEKAGLSSDYLEWFIKALNGLIDRPIQVVAITHKPGYTDFKYRLNNPEKSLSQWSARVSDYIAENNLPLSTKRHKYILLTKNDLSYEVKGRSYPHAGIAIASLKSYTTPAHEISHLLGATHDNAETSHAAGIPCRTIMYPTQSEFIASCYRFSDRNQRAIVDYMSHQP